MNTKMVNKKWSKKTLIVKNKLIAYLRSDYYER